MKGQTISLGIFVTVLLVLLPLGLFAQSNEELLFGTWLNEDASPQKTVHAPGVFREYALISDSSPLWEGTEQIASSWKDSSGSVWYKVVDTYASGSAKGTMSQALLKKSGTLLEFEWAAVAEFDSNAFPSRVNPSDDHYGFAHRAEK